MSELTNLRADKTNIRRRSLATTSALAICMAASSVMAETQADSDRPTVWIELGGQLEQLQAGEQTFDPPFRAAVDASGFATKPLLEKLPVYALGGEGKISLEPSGSDWIFSVAFRYGRSKENGHLHQEDFVQTNNSLVGIVTGTRYADATKQYKESHSILDFMAGKDVGLGIFGHGASSTINAGVRFAQFSAGSTATVDARPGYFAQVYLPPPFGKYLPVAYNTRYHGKMQSERSFHGVGPSISWDGVMPVAGSEAEGEMTLDLGANGAVLFGRQKALIHHQTTATHFQAIPFVPTKSAVLYEHRPNDVLRNRSIAVPNVGGFAGLSLRYPNAKLSIGYRADFFFGAVDGGIDVRKNYDRDFYGPFATLSIGLGG